MANGEPQSQLYKIIHRIADRLEPEYRDLFHAAVEKQLADVTLQEVETALARRDADAVLRAVRADRLPSALEPDVAALYQRNLRAAGQAVSEAFVDATGVSFSFDHTDPNAVLAARRDAAKLVTRIDRETRQALRGVVSDMFTSGVPPDRAAPRIRSMVGLRENHARAVDNFASLLEQAQGAPDDRLADLARQATDRRLDAATKARIRRAIRQRELTPELVEEFTDTYGASLRNRRALDIGRTEAIRAGEAGQQATWRQAADRGHLDREHARRVWIITPDARLRETHAAVPGMNQGGVRLEEPFDTPLGAVMYPPLEPNCRCATSLLFSRTGRVL